MGKDISIFGWKSRTSCGEASTPSCDGVEARDGVVGVIVIELMDDQDKGRADFIVRAGMLYLFILSRQT